MIQNKIHQDHTYLTATNYWTPLDENEDESKEDEEKINMIQAKPVDTKEKSNKWTRRLEAQKEECHKHKIIIDSGAISHFMSKESKLPNIGQSNKTVYLPNNSKLTMSYKTQLPFEQLLDRAREADVLPGLKRSLMSDNKISQEGYTTVFCPGEKGVTIHKEGTITITASKPPVLQGHKTNDAKLWTVAPGQGPTGKEEMNNVYSLQSIPQTVKYLRAAAGFPPEGTWYKAVKAGNFITWPGLTPEAVRKHFPESDETQQGHMKKQSQGVRSTKTMPAENKDVLINPEVTTIPKKMKDVYIKIHNASKTVHTDQTGCFPATSSRGNQYIMVLVEVDGNYIDAESMKNKTEGSMIKAYLALWAGLTASGTVKPRTNLLDNKASVAYKAEIKKNCTIQLVPPDNHRRNLVEQAIQTFKNHFKSVIAGVDNNFPMRLWDRLLPQMVLTLNLLCQSNVALTVSAYQYVHGAFDYNRMPLAPMGCAVQVHESNERRGTWAVNAIHGWYLQTSPEHYCCHIVYVKNTRSKRVSGSVHFKHKYITQPTLTPEDTVAKAIDDLTHALSEIRNTKGILQIKALRNMDKLFNEQFTSTVKTTEPPQEIQPSPRVTFAKTSKPPQEIPTPRVVHEKRPNPRVAIKKATINKAMNNDLPHPRELGTKLKHLIQIAANNRARIQNCHQMSLRHQDHNKQAQLIHDRETGEHLNFRQLSRDPKHKKYGNDQPPMNLDI